MDHTQDELSHTAAVDAWLACSIDHASSVEIVNLFGIAYAALWNRAVTTLGSVTLAAITERILATTDPDEFLSVMNPHSNSTSRRKSQGHRGLTWVPRFELIEGLRFGLIEFLTVIGKLTAEVLRPELHAALLETAANPPAASTLQASPADNLLSIGAGSARIERAEVLR